MISSVNSVVDRVLFHTLFQRLVERKTIRKYHTDYYRPKPCNITKMKNTHTKMYETMPQTVGTFRTILFYLISLEGRRGTTHDFATILFHLVLFPAALVGLAKSIPVHSLTLCSRLFFCLPLFLFPFTVPRCSHLDNAEKTTLKIRES